MSGRMTGTAVRSTTALPRSTSEARGSSPARVVRDRALDLREARRVFFDRDVVPSGLVDDRVIASWQRCRATRLDPADRPEPDALRRDELDALREQHGALLRAAGPVVRTVAAHIDGEPNLVMLADASGFILLVEGNREFAVQARRRDVRPGLLLKESARGTNAPGTCLHESRPQIVHGAEHYLSMYGAFTCSAAPIHGPQGDVIGAINITGDARVLQPYPLALPCMAASLIEQQLFRQTYPMHVLLRFHTRPEYIGALDEGLAVLSEDGGIVAVNRAGLRVLRLENERVQGRAFESLFDAKFAELCGLVRRAVQPVIRLHLQSGCCLYARLEGGDRVLLAPAGAGENEPRESAAPSLRQIETDAVGRAIEAEKGNLSAAARRLGIARTTLYRKLKQRGPAGCRVSQQRGRAD